MRHGAEANDHNREGPAASRQLWCQVFRNERPRQCQRRAGLFRVRESHQSERRQKESGQPSEWSQQKAAWKERWREHQCPRHKGPKFIFQKSLQHFIINPTNEHALLDELVIY